MNWLGKKCKCCRKRLKRKEPTHEIRLDTAEGVHSIEVCEECSRFWDMTAEVLQKPRDRHMNEDTEDDESI
jgi:hypothetical protein